jgi:hypothetical protein
VAAGESGGHKNSFHSECDDVILLKAGIPVKRHTPARGVVAIVRNRYARLAAGGEARLLIGE